METFQEVAEQVLIPAQLACALFGMGATLALRDFVDVLRDPRGIAIGLGLQMVFVPLLALLFTWGFQMSPGWAVGLLLVSVVPGGAMSNLFTFLGRGNTPLSISLTVAATILCIVAVPGLLSILAPSYLPDEFSFPVGRIVRDIFLYLLVPLAAGMVVYRALPNQATRISQWAIRATLVLLATIVISSLGSGRIKVAEYGWAPPLQIVLFGICLAILVPWACRLLGRYDDDTVAIGIEVTIRNVGVGLLLFPFFFPGEEAQGHLLYTCLFYSGISAFLAVPLLLLHRHRRSPVLGARPFRRPSLDDAETSTEA